MLKVINIRGAPEEGATVPTAPVRTPWSGSLDEDEMGRPGGLLIAALIQCGNERRLQLNELAQELGVTYSYLHQLRNGMRQVSQVSDEFALSCARFLRVPRLSVLVLAGRITAEDLFENKAMLGTELIRAMGYICEDPEWGHLVTSELRSSSPDTQYGVVRLYEAATRKSLLDTALSPQTLAQELAKLTALQAARGAAIEDHFQDKKRDSGPALANDADA